MKKILLLIGAVVLSLTANAATPKQALAGCFCGSAGCAYDSLNSANCTRSGAICTMGGGCCKCFPDGGAPMAYDGTISQSSRVASAESRDAMLRRRSCDGAVVDRQYAADEAERLRESTQKLVV